MYYPNTVDKMMAPAAANVFMIESAYFNVAATNNPPAAPSAATITVMYCDVNRGVRSDNRG